MSRVSALRVALLLAVAALLAPLFVAFSGPATSAVPDPSEDHFWLPKRCVGDEPGRYVPAEPGPCFVTLPYRKDRPTVVLWGDSHAWQHLPALVPLAKKRQVNLVLFMIGGCPPILISENAKPNLAACETSNRMALRFVRGLNAQHREFRVLMGAFWDGYYKVYKDVYVDKTADPSQWTKVQLRSARTFHKLTPPLITTLGSEGIRVDLIGQATSVPADPPACQLGSNPYKCSLPRKVALPREKRWKTFFRRMVHQLPAGSRAITNFTSTYCGRTKCQGFTDGVYTYFDPTHLSASRTATFQKFFAPTFRFR
jgi:hypothetical protein